MAKQKYMKLTFRGRGHERDASKVCTANRKKTTIHKEIIDYCPPLRIRLPQNDDDTEKF